MNSVTVALILVGSVLVCVGAFLHSEWAGVAVTGFTLVVAGLAFYDDGKPT